jgi:hypothetical protein
MTLIDRDASVDSASVDTRSFSIANISVTMILSITGCVVGCGLNNTSSIDTNHVIFTLSWERADQSVSHTNSFDASIIDGTKITITAMPSFVDGNYSHLIFRRVPWKRFTDMDITCLWYRECYIFIGDFPIDTLNVQLTRITGEARDVRIVRNESATC